MEENQKKVHTKRVDIVQVKLVREKTMVYKNRRIRSPHDAYEIEFASLGRVIRFPGTETNQIIDYDAKSYADSSVRSSSEWRSCLYKYSINGIVIIVPIPVMETIMNFVFVSTIDTIQFESHLDIG